MQLSTKNDLRINIHIVNVDIQTNLQNIVRTKIEGIYKKFLATQKERALKKNIVFINNRDLKPLDIVLRMNNFPEVAFLGWSLPSFVNYKQNISPSLMRAKILSDPQFVRYKKAFLSQKLRNTLTVLVGNIGNIISKSAAMGLSPQIYLNKKSSSQIETADDLINKVQQVSLLPDDMEEEEMISIDSIEEWENFLRNYDYSHIGKLQIMQMTFNAIIDVQEDESEYTILEQTFNDTVFKIWNIENKYLNNHFISDLQEFSIISNKDPILLVLPKELVRMVVNQLHLEGSDNVVAFDSVTHMIESIDNHTATKFVGVMCMKSDVAQLENFAVCSQAVFYKIDNLLDKDLWEKFKRLDFDITDENEFNILTSNLKKAIDELDLDLDEGLKKHVPAELSDYLKSNFDLICETIKSIISNRQLSSLQGNIDLLYKKEKHLKNQFTNKYNELQTTKQDVFQPLKPIIEEIKYSMIKVKELKTRMNDIYSLNEKIELESENQKIEVEKYKQSLRNIAVKQFEIAKTLGNFLVNDIKKNMEYFKNLDPIPHSIKLNSSINRKIFDFTDEEWGNILGRRIYFVTRHTNLVRLLNTLLKAEGIPENVLIKSWLPNEGNIPGDWFFYDNSLTQSEMQNIKSNKSLFNGSNFNLVLTKTEIQKKELRKMIEKLDSLYYDKAKVLAEKEDELFKLGTQHDVLLYKTRKQSTQYNQALQQFRVLNEMFNSFTIFYKEVEKKIDSIHSIIARLELIGNQQEDKEESASKIQARLAKQIIALTEIITNFYYSLSFLKFTTRILQALPKITQGFRWYMAHRVLEKNKLKNKFTHRVQNVLVVSDSTFTSDRIVEHMMSMMMLQFRITRDRFKLVNTDHYRNYLSTGSNFYVIVLSSDTNQLDAVKFIIKDIVANNPSAVIFSLCQYPSSLIAELELMRDQATIETLNYIRKHSFLSDISNIKPDNKLHISSLYLYAMS